MILEFLLENYPNTDLPLQVKVLCSLNAWQVLVVAFHIANAVVFYLAASLKFDLVHFLIYTTFCNTCSAGNQNVWKTFIRTQKMRTPH